MIQSVIPRWISLTLIHAGLALLITGCGTSPKTVLRDGLSRDIPPPADLASIPDAKPKDEPVSRYGNPASYSVFGKTYHTLNNSNGYLERGIASWYGSKFHGQRTSSGEPYDMYAMTAAHKTLPLPTYVRVRNLSNGRSVVLKVNDRGPFHDNRLIDLSYTAAWKLGIIADGTGLVEVEAINPKASTLAKPEIKPEAKPKKPGLPSLFLQVGAFGNSQNAQRLRSRLETELETNILIQESNNADQPVYRVQVGPIASVELCDDLSKKLDGLGLPQSHIVIR